MKGARSSAWLEKRMRQKERSCHEMKPAKKFEYYD